jgi:hypothetical protein
MTAADAQTLIFKLHDIKPDSLQERIGLYYTIENNSDETVKIKNPAAFGNTQFFLKEDDSTLLYQVKVKINPANENKLVTIAPHATLEVRHDYSLNTLFHIDRAKRHSLYLSYRGIVQSNVISF